MKPCSKCKANKLFTEFYRDKRTSDGLYSSCRTCCYKANKDYPSTIEGIKRWRAKNQPKLHAGQKAWRDTHSDHLNDYHKQYHRRPEERIKYIARQTLARAIRNGEIVRQPCNRCGEQAEAHHEDYNYPLTVDWLCKKHHTEHHLSIKTKQE